MKFKNHTLLLSLMLLSINPCCLSQKIKLVEFGWDYPSVNELSLKLDSIQDMPFDGISFSFQKWIVEAFDTMTLTDAHADFDRLKNLRWGKYKSNFCILRGYSNMGGNWFNDEAWQKIEANMHKLSKAVRINGIQGILFDPEYYLENPVFNPWTYSKQQYPNHTFEETKQQVRIRGKQFIKALQKYSSNFTLLSIWITSLFIEDIKLSAVENARHALLLPFFEGILLAKANGIKIIDGNEYGYWNIRPSQFFEAGERLSLGLRQFILSARAKELAKSIGFADPVYFDGILARHPSFERGVQYKDRWTWLQGNIRMAAIASTENLVWFYNERIDWWQGHGNDTVKAILENVKHDFEQDTVSFNRIGDSYAIDPKAPMRITGTAFTFSFNKQNKLLTIDYVDELPVSIAIYLNGKLWKRYIPKLRRETFKITAGARSGYKLSILTKYNGTKEGVGFVFI